MDLENAIAAAALMQSYTPFAPFGFIRFSDTHQAAWTRFLSAGAAGRDALYGCADHQNLSHEHLDEVIWILNGIQ